MCPFPSSNINHEYLRDSLRGRIKDPSRFWKLKRYAEFRWRKTRDMKAARQWHQIITAVERRRAS
jgi:hypothetical protein